MAQQTQSGGGMFMAFIAGGLLIILAVVAFSMMRGDLGADPRQIDVDVNLPRIEQPAVPDIKPPELPAPNPVPR